MKASEMPETPHNVSAEQAVLGAILLDNKAWDAVSDLISEGDFYIAEHAAIFRTIAFLAEQGRAVDLVSVGDLAVQRQEAIEFAYLADIANETPSAANARHYAQLVREKAILRRTIVACQETIATAYQPGGLAPSVILDQHQADLFAIAEAGMRSRSGFQSMSSSLSEMMQSLQAAADRDDSSGLIGMSCGFTDFDRVTSGLRDQDMIIVAGRPAMGKTSFALNIASHVAIDENKPVGIFSLEMSRLQLTYRMTSTLARVDQNKLGLAKLSDDEWQRLSYATGRLAQAPIFIDDTPQLTSIELRSRARRLHRQHGGLGLVVIDYLQLMRGANGKAENRVQELTEISQSVKALAKELNCPVIALSQLNRGVEQRADKRPVMSDLRESGALEQDADLIAFLYRDEYYNPDSQDKGMAEVIIAKHRNGPIGTVRLAFVGEFTAFENYCSQAY